MSSLAYRIYMAIQEHGRRIDQAVLNSIDAPHLQTVSAEAYRIAKTLPIDGYRVQQLLDKGMSETEVYAHVALRVSMGEEP